jgi:hypothetical protein
MCAGGDLRSVGERMLDISARSSVMILNATVSMRPTAAEVKANRTCNVHVSCDLFPGVAVVSIPSGAFELLADDVFMPEFVFEHHGVLYKLGFSYLGGTVERA